MSAARVEAPDHLNSTGCIICNTPDKGRGVFGIGFTRDLVETFAEACDVALDSSADRTIPAQTVVEISPILLFGKEEYTAHGKYTTLDHYTFVWKDGQYALALGLGEIPLVYLPLVRLIYIQACGHGYPLLILPPLLRYHRVLI